MAIFQSLLDHFGSRGWWPGDSCLEIMIGAILTQAVSWKNVEKAIDNLKTADMLNMEALLQCEEGQIALFIKPALYHRQKARKIKALLSFIDQEYGGDLDRMFDQSLEKLRSQLLGVWGIGPETADSILLYAGNKLIFVVDAYTRRIFARLGMVPEGITYEKMQVFMMQYVTKDLYIYNEYHALLVGLGAQYCKKKNPRCDKCPINIYCDYFISMQEN